MAILVKICGLGTPETLEAALAAGADWVGFVSFPRSPRHLTAEAARALSAQAAGRARRVLLLVDPDDRALDEAVAAVAPDLVQLHGRETPERVAAVASRTGLPAMKSVAIGRPADLAALDRYRGAAERLLLDAKPPPGADRPGGNGLPIDWRWLAGLGADPAWRGRLVLSGGLTRENVAAAVATTGIEAVDVSSGVESRPGEKDPALIEAFVAAARSAVRASRPAAPGRQDRRVA